MHSREPHDTEAPPDNLRRLPGVSAESDLLELEGQALALAMYDRFGDDVNRVVRSILGPDPDHDDLVQKVFTTALAKVGRLRERTSLRSWLVAIAANATRSELRRRRRWRWRSLSSKPIELMQPPEDDDARAVLDDFYRVVDKLPPDQRVAFVLRYVDARPLADVAAMCGCSLATVKRRIARASERFVRLARSNPDLMSRIRQGSTWGDKA